MGLDLKLLPYTGGFFSLSVLHLERRHKVFFEIVKIDDLHGMPVDDDFHSYLGRQEGRDDAGYGITTTTPYGDRLTYVFAKHLKPLVNHKGVTDNDTNRAVWAYLKECPDELKIALYWS